MLCKDDLLKNKESYLKTEYIKDVNTPMFLTNVGFADKTRIFF